MEPPCLGLSLSCPTDSPKSLYRVLASFSLEQYAPKLQELGFSNDVNILATNSGEHLAERLGMSPEDSVSFRTMLELLRLLLSQQQKEPLFRRSNSFLKASEHVSPHVRRRSFGCTENNSQLDENLFCIMQQYQEKAAHEKRQRAEQFKLLNELEEAKKKISELTEQLAKERPEEA